MNPVYDSFFTCDDGIIRSMVTSLDQSFWSQQVEDRIDQTAAGNGETNHVTGAKYSAKC